MVYWICFQPASCCLYHDEDVALGVFVVVVQCSQFARLHHIRNSPTALCSEEIALAWMAWLHHVSHSWKTSVMVSMARSTPPSWALYVESLLTCPDAPWAHRAINSSPFCSQSTSTWAIPILAALATRSLLWYSSVAWLWGTWASTWYSFSHVFYLCSNVLP